MPVRRSRSLLSLALSLVLGLVACGGKGGGPVSPPTGPAAAPASLDEDHTVAETVLEGMLFTPGALGYPSMTQVTRGKTTLVAARKKAGRSAVDAQIFATLAWAAADPLAATQADVARALQGEARDALRAARDRAAGKADAVTLQMLATAELWLGEPAAAAAIYQELLARFPSHEGTPSFKTWLASIDLAASRIADAQALVAGWDPAAVSEIQAYVLAWVGFAAHDYPAARAAIAQAAVRWKDGHSRPGVERDLVLLMARGGAEVAEASRAIAQVAATPKQRYQLQFTLSEAYKFAGAFAEAAAALDVIIDEIVPGAVPPDDLVAFRFRQADYYFRIEQPARAAERAIAAVQALPACAEACAGDTAEAVIKRIAQLAQFSHGVFATTQDPAHHDAAQALYAAYLALPGRPDATTIQGYAKNLADTRANAVKGAAKHGDKLVADLVLVRRESLTACYEAQRVAEPALEGAIKLSLEIAADGEVIGAATDPAGGLAGLAAVASCLEARVRTWRFPARATPGVTKLHVPLVLRPRAEVK